MSGCRFCDGPLDDRHHWTGKDSMGRYLDPWFVVGCCHDHHELTHDDLKGLRLESARELARLHGLALPELLEQVPLKVGYLAEELHEGSPLRRRQQWSRGIGLRRARRYR